MAAVAVAAATAAAAVATVETAAAAVATVATAAAAARLECAPGAVWSSLKPGPRTLHLRTASGAEHAEGGVCAWPCACLCVLLRGAALECAPGAVRTEQSSKTGYKQEGRGYGKLQ